MLKQYISIYLNGKPFNCFQNILLEDLLVYLNVNLNSTLVEYNGTIINDRVLHQIVLKQGDKIELVTIVGGG